MTDTGEMYDPATGSMNVERKKQSANEMEMMAGERGGAATAMGKLATEGA